MNKNAANTAQFCSAKHNPLADHASRPRLQKMTKPFIWRALSLLALFMVPGGALLVLGAVTTLSER